MKKICILLFVFVFAGMKIHAQTSDSSMQCGFDRFMSELRGADPDMNDRLRQLDMGAMQYMLEQNNQQLQHGPSGNPSLLTNCSGNPADYYIPVVVHVIYNYTTPANTGGNIPYVQIQKQIDALNAAFASNYPAYNGQSHNAAAVDTKIRFCLAQLTPGCGAWPNPAEPGVMRYPINPSTYVDGDVYNHVMSTAGTQKLNTLTHGTGSPCVFPYANYLNIWVVNSICCGSGTVIGYATFPNPALNPFYSFIDGIVIRSDVFGDNTVGSFNPALMSALDQGKVLVHEAGHYLGLYHTFEGGCAGSTDPSTADDCMLNGDMICDTPPTTQIFYSCSGPVTGACPNNIPSEGLLNAPPLYEDYMSYADDGCWNTFTNRQKQRMTFMLTSYRAGLSTPSNWQIAGLIGQPGSCLPNQLVADFNYSLVTPCGNSVNLVAVSGSGFSATSWTWTIPGATPSTGTGTTITTTFPTPGVYPVTLVATGTSGSCTATINVTVPGCSSIPANLADQGNWYFGQHAAITFTTSPPSSITPSMINSIEACAAVSDASMGLLFYTDGRTIWNSLHAVMATGLSGSPNSSGSISSAQGAMIVPDPGNNQRYYVFYTPDVPYTTAGITDGLRYCIVDMTLNSGLGGVVPLTLNTLVPGPLIKVSEHLAAVPHCNGKDYWIIVHSVSTGTNNKFLAYLLTPTGILPAVQSPSFTLPDISSSGWDNDDYIGHIEMSRSGTRAAVTNREDYKIYFYTFSPSTGMFTAQSNIASYGANGGTAMSPNGNFVYLPEPTGVRQFNITTISSPTHSLIPYTSGTVPNPFNGVQLGPDDKVYFTKQGSGVLGVVAFPNVAGSGCAPSVSPGVPLLSGQIGKIGLPNMIDALPSGTVPAYTVSQPNCSTVVVTVTPCWQHYTASWTFGDATGTFSGTSVTHTYTTNGLHTITLTLSNIYGVAYTFTTTVTTIATTPVITGPNPVCSNATGLTPYSVSALPGATYLWSITPGGTINSGNGTNAVNVTWTASGTISVTITFAGCTYTSSKPVSFVPAPTASAGPDLLNCGGGAIGGSPTASGGTPGYSYFWSPGTFLSSTTVANPVAATTSTATYTVTVTDANGCFSQDIVSVDGSLCCSAIYTAPATMSTNPPLLPGQSMAINSNLTITGSVVWNGLDVRIAPLVKIFINPGASLTITGSSSFRSHLYACTNMWDGIWIQPGGFLTINNSTLIEDGENAVVSVAGAPFNITETIFNRNYIGIYIQPYAGSHPGIETNCVFTCRAIAAGTTVTTLKGPFSSTPFIQIYPVSSYSQSTLLAPRSGKRSYAGVFIDKCGSTTLNSSQQISSYTEVGVGLGSTYINRNIFDYLDFGIYARNSNISSVNNSFQYITGPTTLTKPAPNYGAAIYGISDELNLSKRMQVGNLIDNSQKNTFYDCARGIDVNGYYDTRLSYNRYQSTIVYSPLVLSLSPVGNYGVFIKSGRFINNTCERNEMVNMSTGVMIISDALLTAPLSYVKFLGDANINGNIFSATVPPYAAPTTESARIGVVAQNIIPTCSGCVLSTTIMGRLHIDNNVIDKLFNGISIQGWPRVPTANINQITLRFQPNFMSIVFAQNGIRIISCGSPQVYRNNITQGTTTKQKLRGIYVSNSSYSIVRCNVINGVGQDLVFEGPCLASTVFNNDLGPAQDGLVLMNNGQIGPQGNVSLNITSDNNWIGPFSNSRTFTWNTYAPNTHSPLVVRNTALMNPALFPLTNVTSPGVAAVDSYNAPGAISTATGGTLYNCQQPPQMATGQTFTSISIQILEKNVQNQVPMFGSAYEAQWMAKQKVGELLKDDPTLSGNSQVLQQFEVNLEQEEFGRATLVNGFIMDNDFNNAISLNNTINAVALIDQNQKAFNAIYLDMVTGRAISEQQRTDLENIAAQCPVTGGPAVYQARALLTAVYDDYVEWEDNCRFRNPAPRFGNESAGTFASAAINLYPNPNDGEMSLDYTLQEGQTGVFCILDVTGRVLMTKELANNEQHTQISAASLAAGVYIWQVTIDGKVVSTDKLVITK